VNAVILAFAVLGLVGALTTDIRWMQLYLLMLTLLFLWELIYILVTAIGTATPRTRLCCVSRLVHLLTEPMLHDCLLSGCRVSGYKQSLNTLTWDITLCIILAVVSTHISLPSSITAPPIVVVGALCRTCAWLTAFHVFCTLVDR